MSQIMQGMSLRHEQETLHCECYSPIPSAALWFYSCLQSRNNHVWYHSEGDTETCTHQPDFHATNLQDIANDHTVNDLRRDLASSQRSPSSMLCQVSGWQALQQPSIGAKRSPLCCDDEHTCKRSKNYAAGQNKEQLVCIFCSFPWGNRDTKENEYVKKNVQVKSVLGRKWGGYPQLSNSLNLQELK